MACFKNFMPFLAFSLGLVLFPQGTAAHGGHNMEKIVEGEAMSVDPIVRGSGLSGREWMLTQGRIRYYGFTFC
jgi:hypothetical protein